jgi:hypothetical protein
VEISLKNQGCGHTGAAPLTYRGASAVHNNNIHNLNILNITTITTFTTKQHNNNNNNTQTEKRKTANTSTCMGTNDEKPGRISKTDGSKQDIDVSYFFLVRSDTEDWNHFFFFALLFFVTF